MDRPDPRTTYDRIADHFAATREHPWPEIESFVADAEPTSLALDVGCGNGRHAETLADRADRVVGLDASRGLLETARRRYVDRGHDFGFPLVQGDAARLPLSADRFGLGVYVATLHHLRPRATRIDSLDELERVLAPGGRALVSVWSTTHDQFDADRGFDTTVDWTLPDGETVPRYYHIYNPEEFDRDLSASSLVVHDAFRASGNCYAVVGPGD
ncbi:class I SAM-dependent methyltransferase [Haloplanus salilacus]|uniref:class I SAM-dependent methyltransferase n=1 Tax=Haloplanus salilacus TaxID=2949994 RepID=UPI0030CDA3C6